MAIMQRLKQRFWWIDVVYPLAVAIFLISVITVIVYSGRPSSRLALLGEQELLNLSLKISPERHPHAKEDVLVVTADIIDMQRLPRAPRGLTADLSVETYGSVIRRLATLGPEEIVVLWNGDTQRFDALYLDPLVTTIKTLPQNVRISIATSAEFVPDLNNALSPYTTVVDSSPCLFPNVHHTHSFCFYSRDWGHHLAQRLAETLAPNIEQAKGRMLTYSLPSNAASYITRLPPPSELTRLSFSQVLSKDLTTVKTPRIAVIGVDATGHLSPTASSLPPRFVRTIFDNGSGDPALVGTPLPVYWGQFAQTLVDGAFIKVPSQVEEHIITLMFCLMMLGIMLRHGGVAASGAFVTYVALSPIVNAISMAYADSYIPLFNTFYFGLSTLVLSGFGRLSFTAWHKWRAQAKSKAMHDAAELKGHFISLLSHNLNTPVAKMQGMLQILSQIAPRSTGLNIAELHVKEAERLATLLQFIIRAVLVATALEENEKALSPRTAKQLATDFNASYKATLAKLGISLGEVTIKVDPQDALDLEFIPVQLDVRAVTMALAGAAYLFAPRDHGLHLNGESSNLSHVDLIRPITVDISFTIRETSRKPSIGRSNNAFDSSSVSNFGLTISLSSPGNMLLESVANTFARRPDLGFRSRTDGSFLQEVLCGLITVTVRSFGGEICAEPSVLRLDIESQA
jgi:hypothetical protein